MKKHTRLWKLLPYGVILLALGVLIWFVFIPIYTPRDNVSLKEVVVNSNTFEEKKYTLENEQLLLTMDNATTHFTVKNKATGQVWESNPPKADSDKLALTDNKARLKSTLILTYGTESGLVTQFNNFAYSIENGVYDIKAGEDFIRVDYTIGKINKPFVIPIVVNAARMDTFLDRMEAKPRKAVLEQYRLYDIDNLKKNDDKAALLESYPMLAEQPIYVLRDGVKDTRKKTLEKNLREAGYTYEDYEYDLEFAHAEEEIEDKPVFNVSVIYRLSGNDLVVEVPLEDVKYNLNYPITRLAVLPAFGAGGTADEGFILVPEGGGAIIDFNNGKTSQNNYFSNVYGWDYASIRRAVVTETRSSFPAFGMAKSGGSFLCLMEEGASWAGVNADIAGKNNSYNTAYSIYTLLHGDQYEVSARQNGRVFMYEKCLPEGTIRQRYRFLDTADYSEMAMAYRDYLTARFPTLTPIDEDSLPVVVEAVGAIDKTEQRAGIPMSRPKEMTSFSEAGALLNRLSGEGLEDIALVYTGWSNGGILQKVLTDVRVLNELGGERALEELCVKAREMGVETYLDGVTQFAYDSGLIEGFIPFRDAARFTTRDKAEIYVYSNLWYGELDYVDPYFLVRPQYMLDMAKHLTAKVSDIGADGVAFRDIGFLLSGDYNYNRLVSREHSVDVQLEAIADVRKSEKKLLIKSGNLYAAPYADLITDLSLRGNVYSILDRSVPFYQMALHGLVRYTGESVNISNDYALAVLDAAESGSGLKFTFMDAPSLYLRDTRYSYLYGAELAEWGDKAIEIAKRFQSAMAGLGTQKIVSHREAAPEVFCTEYENGTRVYVNRSEQAVSVEGVTVPALDYLVKEGD